MDFKDFNVVKESIKSNLEITQEDMNAMIAAYDYGTATPMQALIKCLISINEILKAKKTINVMCLNSQIAQLTEDNFSSFVLEHFDEFLLHEVKK